MTVRQIGEPKPRPKKVRTTLRGQQYDRYLASPAWAAKRQRYWERAGRRCQVCGSTSALEVHHHTYERLGREWMSDLVGLCGQHHQEVHRDHRLNGGTLTEATARVTGLDLV